MSRTVFKALLLDALYQVLDNKVFRILGGIACLFIGLTFLISFGKQDLSILFGLYSIKYADAFGWMLPDGGAAWRELDVDLQAEVVRGMQALFVRGLSGTIGVMLAIAATAFFLPNMLERGTADTLFSRPVSRATLFLARYLSGILFVALLSLFLVVGMHLGFLLCSGYSDTAFLWSALTLVYVFALVHGVSVCIGALTRSSVAAILLSLIFFVFNGFVHMRWRDLEHTRSRVALERQMAAESDKLAADGAAATPDTQFSESAFTRVIDGLHYALPKTSDATFLVEKTRSALTVRPKAFVDPFGIVMLDREPSAQGALRYRRVGDPLLTPLTSEVHWSAADASGAEAAHILLRREHALLEPAPGDPAAEPVRRTKALSSRRIARELERSLTESGAQDVTTWRFEQTLLPQTVIAWSDTAGAHDVRLFGWEDQFYRIEHTWQGAIPAEVRKAIVDDFNAALSMPDVEAALLSSQVNRWYEERFSLDAPLRFNILFSVGSSLAFLAVVLGIGMRRVARMDF